MLTFAHTAGAQVSEHGMRLIPDQVLPSSGAASPATDLFLPPIGEQPPARALDAALAGIDARYGRRTGDVVAMQLEYPR